MPVAWQDIITIIYYTASLLCTFYTTRLKHHKQLPHRRTTHHPPTTASSSTAGPAEPQTFQLNIRDLVQLCDLIRYQTDIQGQICIKLDSKASNAPVNIVDLIRDATEECVLQKGDAASAEEDEHTSYGSEDRWGSGGVLRRRTSGYAEAESEGKGSGMFGRRATGRRSVLVCLW